MRERLVDLAQATEHRAENAPRLRADQSRFGQVAEVVRERHGEATKAITRVDESPERSERGPFGEEQARQEEDRAALGSAVALRLAW